MRKMATTAAAAAALALGVLTPAVAADTSATISGTVGENVSTTDSYDGRHLRYVGDPAPDGYSPWMQWGSPYILTTSPEDGPVTLAGTLDVSGMTLHGQVAVIGLHDADALRAGDTADKKEVGIYVAHRTSGDTATYEVGVTDGDAGGGEWVQRAVTFAAADLPGGLLNVEFVVDGTADEAVCASDVADVPTADGCMTLTVNGHTVTDSYGTIVAVDVPADVDVSTELGSGAHPGWYSAWTDGGQNVGVVFDLDVSPIVVLAPQSADDCKGGGHDTFGFKNQGLCVASVQANERSGK